MSTQGVVLLPFHRVLSLVVSLAACVTTPPLLSQGKKKQNTAGHLRSGKQARFAAELWTEDTE
jgi:hypothetical protein